MRIKKKTKNFATRFVISQIGNGTWYVGFPACCFFYRHFNSSAGLHQVTLKVPFNPMILQILYNVAISQLEELCPKWCCLFVLYALVATFPVLTWGERSCLSDNPSCCLVFFPL